MDSLFRRTVFTVFVLILVLSVCAAGGQNLKITAAEDDGAGTAGRLDSLYMETIFPLLHMELWTERDVQDASHVLMMPMHYAFRTGWDEAMEKYDEFFSRFARNAHTSEFSSLSRMQRMQFLYLGTQYLKLSVQRGRAVNNDLLNIAADHAHNDLYGMPTWKTENTVKEHLEQILNHKVYEESRYSMVVDADFYTLAILCDLCFIVRKTGGEPSDDMLFAAEYAASLLGDPMINTELSDGCWLFQVGVAKDYRDYAYAGNENVYEGIQPMQREDVVADSSHFRRMPLWLISFRDVQADDGLLQKRMDQLGKLFSEKVLKRKDGYWVTTTFIDGTNGVFRYDYHNDGNSIEGYDQSGGTLFLGYWIMLGNDKIKEAYFDILDKLPLPANPGNPYYDHGITVREQNPIMDKNAVWDNGLMEVLVRCICAVGE